LDTRNTKSQQIHICRNLNIPRGYQRKTHTENPDRVFFGTRTVLKNPGTRPGELQLMQVAVDLDCWVMALMDLMLLGVEKGKEVVFPRK